MGRWALALIIGTCFATGCSLYFGGDDDDDVVGVDAAFEVHADAGIDALPDECDPVANTGCAAGDKCTFVVDSAGPPLLGHTDCAPEGDVGKGRACRVDAATGVDDCEGGLYCYDGVCKEICTVAPDSCSAGFSCIRVNGVFESNIGMCDPSCDLYAQDCDDNQACYILLGREGYPTVCAPPVVEPTPANGGCGDGNGPGTQGDCCSYINTCAQGFGCVQPTAPSGVSGLTCAFFCDATGTVAGAPHDCSPPGPGLAPGFECVEINDFFSDVPDLPDSIGFCIDTSMWGPATCWNGDYDEATEDGIDCCAEDNAACPCAYDCS